MNRLQMLVAAGAILAASLPGALAGTVARADETVPDATATVDYSVSALAGMTCTGFVHAEFRGMAWKASAGTFAIVTVDEDVTAQNTPGIVTVTADSNCMDTQDPHLLDVLSATAKSKGARYMEGLSIGTDHFGSAIGPA